MREPDGLAPSTQSFDSSGTDQQSEGESLDLAVSSRPEPLISPRLTLVFAVACGLVVANIFYAQALLDVMARSFQVTSGTAGLIVTVTQAGFALGLLLIVPLGDLLDQRRLILSVLGVTVFGMLGVALAPSIGVLLVTVLVVGISSVVAMILVPLAASLAADAERGRVIGTVMSGLLLGILLARTFAGLVSQVSSWRTVYFIGAALMFLLNRLLWHELPRRARVKRRLTVAAYVSLLRSVGLLIREESVLRRRALYGALVFGTFNVFWTSMAFLLSRPPFSFDQATIGIFGLIGAAGALSASVAGRLADRGLARASTGAFLLMGLVAWALIAAGGQRVLPLILGVIILDLCVQGTHITNQSEIYRLRPDSRSRLTTAYMISYFIGGAVGSAGSALAFNQVGWSGVCLFGGAFVVGALVLWVAEWLSKRPVPTIR